MRLEKCSEFAPFSAFNFFGFMMGVMFRLSHQYQVLRSVVVSFAIDVVDKLSSFEFPFYLVKDNKSVFSNQPIFTSQGMIWKENFNVSIGSDIFISNGIFSNTCQLAFLRARQNVSISWLKKFIASTTMNFWNGLLWCYQGFKTSMSIPSRPVFVTAWFWGQMINIVSALFNPAFHITNVGGLRYHVK